MTRLPNRTNDAPMTVGVDVAKATLEVGFSDGESTLALSNDEAGHEMLIKHLTELRSNGETIGLIVLEATGGLELEVATALQLALCGRRDQPPPSARLRALDGLPRQERSH